MGDMAEMVLLLLKALPDERFECRGLSYKRCYDWSYRIPAVRPRITFTPLQLVSMGFLL